MAQLQSIRRITVDATPDLEAALLAQPAVADTIVDDLARVHAPHRAVAA